MRRRFLTRIAVLGSLLAVAARDNVDTIEANAPKEFVTTLSTDHSAPDAESGSGKASIFGVPREARVLFW